MSAIAAYLFAAVVVVAVAFQLALAAGAPVGHLTMGGRFEGTLPTALRVGAVVQAAVLGALAVVTLARAEVVDVSWADRTGVMMWVVVGVSAISFALNVGTPSHAERAVWAPVTGVMLATSLIVALS